MKTVTIMIVENNADLRNTLRQAFESRGYLTWTCRAPEIGFSILESIQPNIVILDLDSADDEDIFAVMDAWRALSPRTRVIVESSSADAERRRKSMEHGAQAFLTKPYSLAPLFQLLEDHEPPAPPLTRAA